MGRRVALLMAFAGCGHIGFDATSNAGGVGDAGGDGAQAHCAQWNPFGAPVNLNLTGANAHWLGALTSDELTLYFSNWTASTSNDLWVATRATTTDPFALDVQITELDTAFSEWAPHELDDLHLLYSSTASGNYDLMIATRPTKSSAFGAGVPITELNSSFNEETAVMSNDQLRIYFSSSRTTMAALYFAERTDPAQPFSAPVLIPELDSPEIDEGPSLTTDELEIFFESTRGGTTFDIYTARRASISDPFDPPVPVTELNTPNDDTLPFISGDGRRLYFNYNTLTGGGLPSDVWMAERTCASP